MVERKTKPRKMNAARVLFGISRIGYTPASAICDIIDNAVTAEANNVTILIKKKNQSFNLNKKDNVEEYIIIDDGKGMSESEIENALDLGSCNDYYTKDSLSKFGLGLKSASFAQGERLEVISGNGSEIHKEYVDLQEIKEEYFSVEDELTDEDKKLADKYFRNKTRGTIVRISKIRNNNHPSIKSTIDELKEKIGVIYYYFLTKNLHISIGDDEITAFDPLFVDEAGNTNLDEYIWDGKSVQWLLKPTKIQLDDNVEGDIEITMLPHPKVRKNEGISDASIRNKYHITANNYGFYVYRNGRLINWANRLDIIPPDQDFYAFRGRINIHSDADDAFNIDVAKAHINLSEDARDSLDDYIADYKRKCKTAWQNAWKKYLALTSQDSNDISNEITIEIGDSVDTSSIEDDSPQFEIEKNRREAAIVQESHKRAIEDTLSRMSDEGKVETKEEDLTLEDIAETMKGSSSVDALNKIFKVSTITDNKLWEPYVDAEKKECVRISKNHRYAKLIYENNSANKDLQILFEILLYIEAKAELQVRKEYHGAELEIVSQIMDEYRIAVSEKLAKVCRKEEGKLPPNTEG
ncbi:ATP-binding protein [Eubacterium sp. MSJ-21]|nr:ATP-binding protein [Eubacterium sp. MSJ-21]